MGKGKTRKFIDKKNSVTFHLVHHSQKDPLVADETAPQRVLVPAADTQATNTEKKTAPDYAEHNEEQQKYGISFDDDYNYLQHRRDVNTLSVEWQRVENSNSKRKSKDKRKINLPSSVFASNVEKKVGMLNKAAPVSGPQLDLDPDVVAAMDDDFDYDDPENQLEDNLMELANVEGYKMDISDSKDKFIAASNIALSDEESDEVKYKYPPELAPDPKMDIKKIQCRKSGIPKYVLGKTGKLTAATLAKFDCQNNSKHLELAWECYRLTYCWIVNTNKLYRDIEGVGDMEDDKDYIRKTFRSKKYRIVFYKDRM